MMLVLKDMDGLTKMNSLLPTDPKIQKPPTKQCKKPGPWVTQTEMLNSTGMNSGTWS